MLSNIGTCRLIFKLRFYIDAAKNASCGLISTSYYKIGMEKYINNKALIAIATLRSIFC